tara:strand:- start:441 stop:2279 length:1839 start_codon:yes stop_codon:yes gene_type:complete
MAQKIEYEVVANTKAAQEQINKVNKSLKDVSKSSKKASNDLSATEQVGNEGIKVLDRNTGGLATKFVAVGKAAKLSGKAMKTALISSGIGLAVALVTTLVENWDQIGEVLGFVNKDLERQKGLNDELLKSVNSQLTLLQKEQKFNELRGISNSENLEKQKKILLAKDAILKSSIKILQTQLLQEQASAKEITTLDKINAGFQGFLFGYSKQAAILAKAAGVSTEEQKKLNDLQGELNKLKGEELDLDLLLNPPAENKKEEKVDTDPAIEEKAKTIEEIAKLEDAYFQKQLDKQTQELNAVSDKYFGLIEKAKKFNLDTTELEEQRNAEETAINEKYRLQAKAETEKNEKELADLKNTIAIATAITEDEKRALEIEKIKAHYTKLIELARAQGILTAELEAELNAASVAATEEVAAKNDDTNTNSTDKWLEGYQKKIKKIGQWVDLVGQGLSVIAKMQKSNHDQENRDGDQSEEAKEKRAKRQFQAQKKLNIAMAVVNASQAILSSLAQAPVATPVGVASLAIATAAGLANIAAIAKTKFGSVSRSPEPPDVGAVTSSAPPAFNIVGSSGTNQLADAIGGQSQQPIQAYVVSGEVTTAQELDRNIINDASIGG